MIKIGVTGYNGRMGKIIAQQVMSDDSVELSYGYRREDASGTNITDDLDVLFENSDVVIDFTRPSALMIQLEMAAQYNVPLVIGSTGLSQEHKALLTKYSKEVPIVYSSNMSVGVNVMLSLVQKAASMHDESYDVEISELHHRHKVDAPSGTAISLGEAVQIGQGLTPDSSGFQCRNHARKQGEIGFAIMRGGEVAGDHAVNFIGDQEVLTISHRALSPDMFAKGAIKAAKWIIGKKPGLYSMQDVLGLKEQS